MKPYYEELLEQVIPYPTHELIHGQTSAIDEAKCNAVYLYDEWVCDRRWRPIDLIRMILAEAWRRGEKVYLDSI